MSVYDDRKDALEEHEFRMGLERSLPQRTLGSFRAFGPHIIIEESLGSTVALQKPRPNCKLTDNRQVGCSIVH
jgi:hypothetical protein